MTKQARAQLTGGLQLGGGALACLAFLLVLAFVSPDIQDDGRPDPFAPTEGNRPARQGPTSTPLPPVHLDKTKLIIQQNNQCWIGVPGATCDPKTRTYN